MTPRGTRRRRQSGNAMVEFAVAAGLLIPCFVGVFEFGYGFYVYNRLTAAVRGGARYASLLKYDSATTNPSHTYSTAVQNMVVYGSPAGGTDAVVPGLTADQVVITMAFANEVPDVVTVAIRSFSLNTVFATLNWGDKPAASFRYEGNFAPSGG